MRHLPTFLVLVLALATFLPAASQGGDMTFPCGDPQGCPDLVSYEATLLQGGPPRTENFPPSHCAVQEGYVVPGDRVLLRLGFWYANQGEGDLVLGHPWESPGLYTWSPCHGHWHLNDFAAYRLWTPEAYAAWSLVRLQHPEWGAGEALAAHPELREGLVEGDKRGFCVQDMLPMAPTWHGYAPPDPRRFLSCSFPGQSRGWSDIYEADLDGQWIDVTDVAPGAYVLEGEVNPERLLEEMDPTNNRAAVLVVVPPRT